MLSTAYIFGQPTRKVENERQKLMADNDWTAAQVAQYPGRLVGFCGISPLKDYALEELARCAKNPNLRNGLKLHLGNAVVDYHDPAHVEQMRRVFRAANGYRMPIVVHMRSSTTAKLPYGRDEAAIFFNEILPAAPDVDVQIAHLAGAGGYEVPAGDQALQVFVDAIAKRIYGRSGCVQRDDGRLPQDASGTRLIDRAADPRAGRSARPLRIRRGDRVQLGAQGRMGGVSHAAADRGRVPDHRRQRAALHALIRRLMWTTAYTTASTQRVTS